MLRARANAAGMGPARTPPLISEESEGLATLVARNADGSEEVESKISRDVTPHPKNGSRVGYAAGLIAADVDKAGNLISTQA